MKSKLIFPALLIFVIFSCRKDDLSDIDYFAFGTAYGECFGDCATFYMIKGNYLYPDNIEYYTGSISFKSEPFPDEKFTLAIQLINKFPEYLLDNPDKTFGCPDCADQGGIHIEISDKGKLKKWHIDTTVENQPAEIRSYIELLIGTMRQLK